MGKNWKEVKNVAKFTIVLGIFSVVSITYFVAIAQLVNETKVFHYYADGLIGSILSGKQQSPDLIKGLKENELPICVGNLLDQQEYDRNVIQPKGSYESSSSQLIFITGSCRLLHYTSERVVANLDTLYNNRDHIPYITDGISPHHNVKPALHFVFIGDSRIRQQFFNFIKVIPDYDLKSQPSSISISYHGNIEITSSMLRLRVSFIWWPLLDDNVTETLRQWTVPNNTETPRIILLSMTLWHIVRIHSIGDFKVYQKKLTELAPILDQLTKFSEIIWLNQYPTTEFYGGMPYGGANNSDIIIPAKIHRYNEAVWRIFEKYSSIRIWNSSNYLAEEYVRSCALLHRSLLGTSLSVDPDYTYINCDDYIHTGYSALSQASQLLLNHIFNKLI